MYSMQTPGFMLSQLWHQSTLIHLFLNCPAVTIFCLVGISLMSKGQCSFPSVCHRMPAVSVRITVDRLWTLGRFSYSTGRGVDQPTAPGTRAGGIPGPALLPAL